MLLEIDAGQVKRIHLFTTAVRDNRGSAPANRFGGVWVVLVGDDPDTATVYLASAVQVGGTGQVRTVYSPDKAIKRTICGAASCVEAWLETTERVRFTTRTDEGFAGDVAPADPVKHGHG